MPIRNFIIGALTITTCQVRESIRQIIRLRRLTLSRQQRRTLRHNNQNDSWITVWIRQVSGKATGSGYMVQVKPPWVLPPEMCRASSIMKNHTGMQWITVKCGDGGSIWSQFTSDLVTRAHDAGLKIFGWAYVYGNNVQGEINVALNALNLGADGFIIDAEGEYETLANNSSVATTYCTAIKTDYPNRFLAHAPFPYISYHSGFPYVAFGKMCDAVMPQVYWDTLSSLTGGDPVNMIADMDAQWHSWQNSLSAANKSAIKPIIPIGQGYNNTPGLEITTFINALKTDPNPASVTGYKGVSFWSCQHHNADEWIAIGAASIGDGGSPPYIISNPSSRWVDTGGKASLRVEAGGAAPLHYQWWFQSKPVSNAVTNAYVLSNIQSSGAGGYRVVVTNAFGSVTSSVSVLTVNPPYTRVFVDRFDVNSAANWTINQSSADTRATFLFNYAAVGIPSSPHSSGGTTLGVKFEANRTQGVPAAICMSPAGKSFTGDYRLHFDMWINANGPFPLGGNGSTEHFTAGIGTSGNHAQWNSGAADGVWFAIDGEGQASATAATLPDVRAYVGASLESASSGAYAAGTASNARDNGHPYYANMFPGGQTPPSLQESVYSQQTGGLDVGTLGFGWHDVIISRTGNLVQWFIDGLKMASINSSASANNVFVGYWDSFASLSDNSAMSFGLVDNVRVEVPAQAAQFQVVNSLPGQELHIAGSGYAGATYVIETSTNLQTWVTLTNIVAMDGKFEFIVPTTNAVQQFFRAKSLSE